MNIRGLDKAAVLMALFNASAQRGMGLLQTQGAKDMDIFHARDLISTMDGDWYLDYLHGRVMKIDIGEDEVETYLYNRDNGIGAAERAVDAIRVKQ
jgi:hypothetical protein